MSFTDAENTTFEAFPKPTHDHSQCVKDALTKALAICQVRGVRFTKLRKQVFELVCTSHKPIGAYDILDTFQKRGRKTAPPTVYRALDFLLEQGLIHRIASLNAYIGCDFPQEPHRGQFIICKLCGEATELVSHTIEKCIAGAAAKLDFQVQSRVIEILGVCSACQ